MVLLYIYQKEKCSTIILIYIYYTSICVLKFEFIFFFSNLDTQNLYKWNKIVYKNALDIVEED